MARSTRSRMPVPGRTIPGSERRNTSSTWLARCTRSPPRPVPPPLSASSQVLHLIWGFLRASNDDQAKLASLNFLGHWVGDIHQPLHVCFADDRGGNLIRESGPCVNSLHTVWDTCMIEKKLGTGPQTIADVETWL